MANCWAGNTRAMWHANTYTCQYVSRVCEYECVYVHLFQVPAEVWVRQKLKQKQAATWQRF